MLTKIKQIITFLKNKTVKKRHIKETNKKISLLFNGTIGRLLGKINNTLDPDEFGVFDNLIKTRLWNLKEEIMQVLKEE